MTGNRLELFRKFFGAVRAVFFLTLWVLFGSRQPRGPKSWKISRSPSGIEIFKRDWNGWHFQARLKISSEPPTKPLCFVGNSQGQDWKFQARLKFSSDIENFKRKLEIFKRSSEIGFFQDLGPLGPAYRTGLPRIFWELDKVLRSPLRVFVFRVPSVALQEEHLCAHCARKPPNGPSKNLLKTTQDSWKAFKRDCFFSRFGPSGKSHAMSVFPFFPRDFRGSP